MRKVLWLILILSIIFITPLINLRVANELNNNSVILAYDFQKFMSNNEYSNLKDLKKYGISSVILNGDFIGANTELFDKINSRGLQIILNLDRLDYSENYYKDLEYVIKKYNIRYLLVYNSHIESADNADLDTVKNIEKLAELINKNNLVFFVMENREQTGYMPVPGLESLIGNTNYSLNRAFTISHHSLKISNGQDAVMMWLRSVVDRNIRLVCIEPYSLSKDVTSDNYTLEVLEASKKLSELLIKKGFSINEPVKKANAGIPDKYYNIPIIINIIAAIALFLDYSGIKKYWIYVFLVTALIFACLSVFGFIGADNNIWAAFAAAVIYPSMANAVLLSKLKSPSKNIIRLIIKSLLIILAVNGIGVCTVIASMADIRYTMGLINFNLAIPAFTIPFIMFNVNFIFMSWGQYPLYKKIIDSFRKNGFKKFAISNLIYVFACSVIITVYFLRSGNYNILPEFSIELKMRELLELALLARPRTKEFLIAYPCLFAFLYLYQKNPNYKLLSFLGSLSSIIGISIINSFCHGFTPVLTSLLRTFNGLLLGVITGCISLTICFFSCKILKE